MTSNLTISNPAEDLIRIHKVITRGINVGMTKGSEYIQNGSRRSRFSLVILCIRLV